MRYEFRCKEHGSYIVQAPITEGPTKRDCPSCGNEGVRIYESVTDIWHTDGAHKDMYDERGDKKERLNREWSRATGEKPPPPAPDIPRNSGEPV